MPHKIERLKEKILNNLKHDSVMPSLVLQNKVMRTKYKLAEYSKALDELLDDDLIAFNGTFYHLSEA